MAYLGNSFNQQSYTPATDFFSGNGVTTTFTLTRPIQSVFGMEVVVNNVQQNPKDTYTINATGQIVFVAAPSTGTNNIYVNYNAPIAQLNGVGQGTVGTQQLGSVSNINSNASNMTLQVNTTPVMTLTQNAQLLISGSVGIGVTPIRQFHNFGENSFTPLAINQSTAFFNIHNETGNSGTNMSVIFRGLISNGGAGSNLANFSVQATTSSFNGYLLTPNQPVASVSYSGGDITATAIIPLNSGAIAKGGMTIASNRITVPVAGTYILGFHHLGTANNSQLQIRVNGSAINGGSGSNTQINPATAHGNGSVQNPVALSANDYIEFWQINGIVHGNASYNRMYAYLLG